MRDRIADACLMLVIVALAALTWRKWGYLPVDSGREVYVPFAIAQGKRLYFDLWYPYGPLIPYFHAALFRLFGIHLGVLFGAGIGVVTVAALLLYRVSRVFLPMAWSFAAAFVFLVQAFQADLFNYILPYSYPAAYGSMLVILLLWLLLRNRLLAAGAVAGLAALAKIEFGAAAYAALACWLALRYAQTKSAPAALRDAAAFLPGALLAAVVYGWYLHALGADFFLGQNLAILPGSYFQQHFATMWNHRTGLDLSVSALAISIGRGLGGFVLVAGGIFLAARSRIARWLLFAAVLAMCLLPGDRQAVKLLRLLFFNSGLVWSGLILVALAAKRWIDPRPALLLTVVAMICALRTLTRMAPDGYPIYFDVLAYLMWLTAVAAVARKLSIKLDGGFGAGIAALFCAGVAALTVDYYPVAQRSYAVSTERGTVYTTAEIGQGYAEALAFLETAKRNGERVAIFPEDTFLYFLSGALAPSRWYLTLPQVLPPGRLTAAFLDELERANLRYVLVSDRATPEFGLPLFGLDYGREIQSWLDRNYRVVRRLGDYQQVEHPRAWGALVYERR